MVVRRGCALLLLVLGCGPNVEGTSGGATGSSSAAETSGSGVTSTGAPEPTGGGSTDGADTTSSTTAAADTTTGDSSSSTGAFVCPPRELPETVSGWWRVTFDGRIVYPLPEAAECTVMGTGPGERGGTAFELSCIIDGESVVVDLQSSLDLEPNPVAPGMALTWSSQTETCCPDADRLLTALRDADGALVLGVFAGWNPTVESPSLLDPITFEMVRDVCRPCDTIGCVTRGALDIASDDSGPVRIYDGTSADLPGYRAIAVRVADGADGIGAPDATARVIVLRTP